MRALTALDLQALDDPSLVTLRCAADESVDLTARKGDQHERCYLELLREQGRAVVDIPDAGGELDERIAGTLAAM